MQTGRKTYLKLGEARYDNDNSSFGNLDRDGSTEMVEENRLHKSLSYNDNS